MIISLSRYIAKPLAQLVLKYSLPKLSWLLAKMSELKVHWAINGLESYREDSNKYGAYVDTSDVTYPGDGLSGPSGVSGHSVAVALSRALEQHLSSL